MAPLREILGNVLLGLDHVGLAVNELEVALAHWNALGLESVHQEQNIEQGIDEAMLAIPEDTYIQLIAPLGPDTTIAKFLDKNGEGLQQIAYRVTDINQAMTLVSDAGLRLIYPEPRIGTSNSKINFIHPKDAGGILVELVEHSS
jgi:methylmalonyl-CoA/ethylmalonyl-CoA epimerase